MNDELVLFHINDCMDELESIKDAFGNLSSITGTPQSPFGFVGNEGYQEDEDSGLKLLGHRYYDPSTGRFLARDPAQDGRNWYVYCDSSLTFFVDASGLQAKPGDDDPIIGHRKKTPHNWDKHTKRRAGGWEKNEEDPGWNKKKVKGNTTRDPDGSKKRAREIADGLDSINPSFLDGTPILDWINNQIIHGKQIAPGLWTGWPFGLFW